jgi:hypothetical protein
MKLGAFCYEARYEALHNTEYEVASYQNVMIYEVHYE